MIKKEKKREYFYNKNKKFVNIFFESLKSKINDVV